MKAENKKQFNKAESSKLDQSSFGLSALSFPLKIGFDGKRASNNTTGLGNYSRALIEHLSSQFPENQYYVYTPKVNANIQKSSVFSKKNVSLVLPSKNNTSPLWRSVGIVLQLMQDHIKLFHGLSHEIPFALKERGIKSIVTIHDLIFLVKPNYYSFFDRLIYKFKSKYASKHADRIIAISEQTKNDIIKFYKTDANKIDVIYQSCDDQFKTLINDNEKEVLRDKYQLPQHYLLNVGTIEERKNLLLLIKALPQIDASYPLIVIGRETKYALVVKAEIEKLGLQKRVIFLKDVPFSDFPGLYQMASTFIYPSFYEGFGIPIIEALYGKIPVVAATGSCLEEAGGPDSLYVSPEDSDALANAVNSILQNKTLSTAMTEKGLTYVQRFNTEVVTQQIMDCYVKTLSE